jgi:hypothetical protein
LVASGGVIQNNFNSAAAFFLTQIANQVAFRSLLLERLGPAMSKFSNCHSTAQFVYIRAMTRCVELEPFSLIRLHIFHFFSKPVRLALLLAIFTAIPVLNALVLVFQIPSGSYPEDSGRLAVFPISWFTHVLAGVAFGITGPVQFVRALRHRFGALHRAAGRVFVLSGAILGLSGLTLLANVTSQRTPVADIARGLFGLALLIALVLAMAAIRDRDFVRHRAWAIRAYAIGIGLGAVALVFFPIFILTGQPPSGLASDILFVTSWVMSIASAELVVRYSSHSRPRVPP